MVHISTTDTNVNFLKDFQYKTISDFLYFQIALTRNILARKMFFFLNRSEFRQKLIGYVISELRRQKCVLCRQN